MKPLVYLREEEINALFERGVEQSIVEGRAVSLDEDTVFHVYLHRALEREDGESIPAKIVIVAPADTLEHISHKFRERVMPGAVELVILLKNESGKLQHHCFLIRSMSSALACEIRFIPVESDLYSRSKGLLETDVLKRKSVGIVGLGSGGSPLAIELAKAGIGTFVLIDFDRLELSNIARHVCGVSDLGRYKTFAVKDAILQKNPHARVSTFEIDVNEQREICASALSKVDLLLCASDNDRSRFFLNEIALKYRIPAIFGRAITRACGGDVLRVRPFQGPCYSCLYSQNVRSEGSDDEEISQSAQAKKMLPEYTSAQDLEAVVQVGLSSDIAPISNLMVKLALVELSRGTQSGISSLEDDLISDFYIWANRRDNAYKSWSKFEYNFDKPSILRWYGARVERDISCMICGN